IVHFSRYGFVNKAAAQAGAQALPSPGLLLLNSRYMLCYSGRYRGKFNLAYRMLPIFWASFITHKWQSGNLAACQVIL
ncbi:MAG TPA: hypothetical protein VIU43_08230, partial [Nitrosospira sp.]